MTNAKRMARRFFWMDSAKFQALYDVMDSGQIRRTGLVGVRRRARKEARKARTSFPVKMTVTGGYSLHSGVKLTPWRVRRQALRASMFGPVFGRSV